MEVILLENENSSYNHSTHILAQFLSNLRQKYPEIVIRQYNRTTIEELANYVDLDFYNLGNPIIILNGHILSTKGIPDINDITNYIEEVL